MSKTAFVTGANTGIGYEVVKGLARKDFIVYLGSRDPKKGEDAVASLKSFGDVRLIHIDTTEEKTFGPALDKIEREQGRLDVLVNNAGASLSGSVLEVDPAVVRESFETNFHGPMRLTQLAVPLLRKSPAGRIVNVSSSAGRFDYMNRDQPLPYAYCTSKTAMNAGTVMFAAALRKDGIKVNACCPGFVKSQVSRFTGTRTPEQGSRIVIELATLDDDGPTGGFFNENGPLNW